MNKKKEWLTAKDTTSVITVWSLWYLGILFVLQVGLFYLFNSGGASTTDFFTAAYGSSKVYMLVIGIVGAYYFLPVFVQLGVTRKKAFYGTLLGVMGAALILTVLSLFLAGLQQVLMQLTGYSVAWGRSLFTLYGSLPAVSRWVLTVFTYILSLLLNYAVGWLIGTGFYRFGVWGGAGFILLGIGFSALNDMFWGESSFWIIQELTEGSFLFSHWSIPLLGTLVLTIVLIWLLRQLTKRMAIKF